VRFAGLYGMSANEYTRRAPHLSAEIMEYVRALYDSEVRHVDDYLREVFEALPRAEKALVVFTSDHGEEFLEHGGVLHGRTLFDESIRVPMIFRFPDRRHAGTVVDEAVSLIDILPTVLDAVGAEPPAQSAGTSLLTSSGIAAPRDRTLVAELLRTSGLRASIGKDWKFIHNGDEPELSALFRISEDPEERNDLLSADPERKKRLEKWIANFARENEQKKSEAAKTAITPEQLEALKALGYVN